MRNETAFWRSRAMADAMGAAAGVATLPEDLAHHVTETCAACRYPDRCLLWRLESVEHAEAPGYCLNNNLFGGLSTAG